MQYINIDISIQFCIVKNVSHCYISSSILWNTNILLIYSIALNDIGRMLYILLMALYK